MNKTNHFSFKKSIALLLAFSFICFSLPSNNAIAIAKEHSIVLSDEKILFDNNLVTDNTSSAVYVGEPIIYYEDGKDESYGEGTSADSHSKEEADSHTVVTIKEAGTYRISGTLSKGQVSIDLGSDAKENPDAVVTLILDNANITSTVAPAIIFYNVFECGDTNEENAAATVDTSDAGARILIADDSTNNINGAYVARIYKEGTTKKLHKYDGAFYSKMSMTIDAELNETGTLYIVGENEGLDSELHLTINGGNVFIKAQDDAINTNEDNISVTTINGGSVYVDGGLGTEGDGIDSNGYLVINNGTLVATANEKSGDGGIDADKGIYINGGTVVATGSRNDSVSSDSKQLFIELSFRNKIAEEDIVYALNENDDVVFAYKAQRNFSSFTYSSNALTLDTIYHLYLGGHITGDTSNGLYKNALTIENVGEQLQYTSQNSGNMRPPMKMDESFFENMDEENMPTRPDIDFDSENRLTPPEDRFTDENRPEPPEGFKNDMWENIDSLDTEGKTDFVLSDGKYSFSNVSTTTEDSTEIVSDLPFSDINATSSTYQSIYFLYNRGIISGNNENTFEPQKEMTLGMLLVTIGKAEDAKVDLSTSQLHWAYPYAVWAENNGIISSFTIESLNSVIPSSEIFSILESVYEDISIIDTNKYESTITKANFSNILFTLIDN